MSRDQLSIGAPSGFVLLRAYSYVSTFKTCTELRSGLESHEITHRAVKSLIVHQLWGCYKKPSSRRYCRNQKPDRRFRNLFDKDGPSTGLISALVEDML